MSNRDKKCVIVTDEDLPVGIIANTTAILGVTLGSEVSEYVGEDGTDASGNVHKGIIKVPIPVLKGDRSILRSLREKLYSPDYRDMVVVDFSDVAQGCHTYDEYTHKAGETKETDHTYLGIAIFGDKKRVNKLTGSMPLLR